MATLVWSERTTDALSGVVTERSSAHAKRGTAVQVAGPHELHRQSKMARSFRAFTIADVDAHSGACRFVLREVGDGLVCLEALDNLEVVLHSLGYAWRPQHVCSTRHGCENFGQLRTDKAESERAQNLDETGSSGLTHIDAEVDAEEIPELLEGRCRLLQAYLVVGGNEIKSFERLGQIGEVGSTISLAMMPRDQMSTSMASPYGEPIMVARLLRSSLSSAQDPIAACCSALPLHPGSTCPPVDVRLGVSFRSRGCAGLCDCDRRHAACGARTWREDEIMSEGQCDVGCEDDDDK